MHLHYCRQDICRKVQDSACNESMALLYGIVNLATYMGIICLDLLIQTHPAPTTFPKGEIPLANSNRAYSFFVDEPFYSEIYHEHLDGLIQSKVVYCLYISDTELCSCSRQHNLYTKRI